MITKAIIKKLCSLEDNHFSVYIPLLRKANSGMEDAILSATLCNIPGIDNSLKVGDVVYVGFEDDQYDKPIILGKLYIGKEDKNNITTTLTTRSLQVTEISNIPSNTVVGDINVIDLYTKLTWLMNNNFLPARVLNDEENKGELQADSEMIGYTNDKIDTKTVKETLDYIISKLS